MYASTDLAMKPRKPCRQKRAGAPRRLAADRRHAGPLHRLLGRGRARVGSTGL